VSTPGLLIEDVPLLEDRPVMARMSRTRRDKPDATVSMLVVVPAHERQDPRAGRLQGGKALGGIRRPVELYSKVVFERY
jgi:hypothetical protein